MRVQSPFLFMSSPFAKGSGQAKGGFAGVSRATVQYLIVETKESVAR